MKREIKFRAFYDNRMHDNVEAMRILYNNSTESPLTPKYPIMQFTGLHDKNGVEIYENDFVKISMGFAERICEVVFRNGGFIVESDGFFGSEESDISLIGWAIDEMDSIEVIGNIYSNPELTNPT